MTPTVTSKTPKFGLKSGDTFTHYDTVAEAFLRDLVAEPHGEHRARQHDGDNVEIGPERIGKRQGDVARILHRLDDAVSLDGAKKESKIARGHLDLLAAVLALFRQFRQSRENVFGKKFDDDLSGDIRRDAQGEDGEIA